MKIEQEETDMIDFGKIWRSPSSDDRARACYTVHQGACEQWTHGEPVEVWRDENHILCIRYADGNWWHYVFKPTGLEWW